MADSGFLEEISQRSLGYQILVILTPMALGALFYWQFMYADMNDHTRGLEGRLAQLSQEQKRLDADVEEQRRLTERKNQLEEAIRANQRALPTEAELPAFFDYLQRRAGDAGVTIRSWDQMPEEPVDAFMRVPVRMEIVGTFSGLMRYFQLLGPPQAGTQDRDDGSVRVGERIVSIENLSLVDPKLEDNDVLLTARFVASTFRQAPEPQDPAAAAQAQGGARR